MSYENQILDQIEELKIKVGNRFVGGGLKLAMSTFNGIHKLKITLGNKKIGVSCFASVKSEFSDFFRNL